MKFLRLLSIALGVVWALPALAQTNVLDNFQTPTGPTQVSSVNPLPVIGSFSATLSGFAPGGSFAHLTSTASSADTALPTGAVDAVFNTGTTAVSCNFTIGAGSALANENIIQPNSWIGITVGSNTHFSCVNQAGDAANNVVVASGGTGLPTGAGGGGSGSSTVTANQGTQGSTGSPWYFDLPSATPASTNLGTVLAAPPNLTYQATFGGACSYSSGTNSWCGDAKGGAWIDIGGVNGAILSVANPLFTEITDGANGAAAVKAASTATVAADKALVVGLSPNSGTPARTSDYPFGATPLAASATGTTSATTATLTGTSSTTVYLCSYSVRANATAATTVTDTATGVLGGTLSHILWVAPAASGLGVDEQIYQPCVPASGTNQAIAVVSGAPGSGGNVSVVATGYYK